MIKFSYKKNLLVFNEIWYSKSQEDYTHTKGVDIVILRNSDYRVAKNPQEVCNGVINLRRPTEEIESGYDKKFIYETNRAIRENITIKIHDSESQEVFEDYISFCSKKNISIIPITLLKQLITSGNICIASSIYNNTTLSTHIYLTDNISATLLASFESDHHTYEKKYVGWANRLLHREVIKHFHKLNYSFYSLGGLGNPPSKETINIVKFKDEMSPERVFSFDQTIYITFLAKLFFILITARQYYEKNFKVHFNKN